MATTENQNVTNVVITESPNLRPDCPFCERELREVYYKPIPGPKENCFIYFCPNCKKVLGVS